MALLLSNGSMRSQTSGEDEIRKQLIENDLVECVVALPGQLFTNTQIPACIWFLTKNKTNRTLTPNGKGRGNRKGKILFIDTREKGYMKDRVLRDFNPEEIQVIAETITHWKRGSVEYKDIASYCKSATLRGDPQERLRAQLRSLRRCPPKPKMTVSPFRRILISKISLLSDLCWLMSSPNS